MNGRRLTGTVIALVAGAAISFCLASRPATAAPAGARWGADYFPNVPLVTQDGQTVHFYDDLLKGKIVAINLIYTHCQDSCPLETARLVQVQHLLGDRVGKDIFFYSISIDPKRDTHAELKAYAEKFHAGPGWLFLHGSEQDVELISKKLGLFSDPDPANRDGHTPSLLIGNESTGQWMRNSATDNPRFLALMIGDFLDSWKNRKQAAVKNYSEATHLKLDQGQYLFATRCSACHTIGHGDKIGPDLAGVTKIRSREWLVRFISTPDQVLKENDPVAAALFNQYKQVNMPNLRLAPEDVATLISFLEAQSTAASAPSQPKNIPLNTAQTLNHSSSEPGTGVK